MAAATGRNKKEKHLGLRLSDEHARKLEELVQDEASKAGPYVSVSASSFVLGLIVSEHARRFPSTGKARPKGEGDATKGTKK